MKQVIVARTDIGMTPGKLAAQVAHSSLIAYEHADVKEITTWKRNGQKKIVLQVDNERSLFELQEEAKTVGLPTGLVRDAGNTELDSGTVTVLAIGPGDDDEIDRITGHLSLY